MQVFFKQKNADKTGGHDPVHFITFKTRKRFPSRFSKWKSMFLMNYCDNKLCLKIITVKTTITSAWCLKGKICTDLSRRIVSLLFEPSWVLACSRFLLLWILYSLLLSYISGLNVEILTILKMWQFTAQKLHGTFLITSYDTNLIWNYCNSRSNRFRRFFRVVCNILFCKN